MGSTATASLRLLHCDDSAAYRRLVALLLESCDDVEIVGCATSHTVAIEEVRRMAPDVVLLDMCMPNADPDVIAGLKAAAPGCRVIVLTGLDAALPPEWGGADGCVRKSQPFATLAAAIRA